jgi:hypothetical protein
MHVVNVLFRVLLVTTGIFLAFGLSPFDGAPSPLHEVFGTVVALYGIYRLVTYYTARQRSES